MLRSVPSGPAILLKKRYIETSKLLKLMGLDVETYYLKFLSSW